MSYPLKLFALPSLILLGGCSGVMTAASVVSSGIVIAEKVSTVVDPAAKIGCAAYLRGREAAEARIAAGLVPRPSSALARSIYTFGDAACANPPNNTLETVIWFGKLAGQIEVLTTPKAPASKP